jgi:hypothetical protein
MLMSEAGTCFKIAEDYRVILPEGDHLVLVVGVPFGCPAGSFEHPNIAAKQSAIFEFKHCHPKRGKFWTAKAGVEFYFLVPKKHIELLPEKGYSYVQCSIAGTKFFLNVSGGGGQDGWSDSVRLTAHTGVTEKKSYLKLFANHSVVPYDFEYEVRYSLEGREKCWSGLACRHSVEVGMKVCLDGNKYKELPYTVSSVDSKRRCCVGRDNTNFPWRIKYSQIDWLATAELNGVDIPVPIRVSKFKELSSVAV